MYNKLILTLSLDNEVFMVSLSVKGKYGVAAVFELSQHSKGEPIQIRQLSQSCQIPQNYLEQILVVLKKEGIVKSFRGAQGGYELAKPSNQITIKDVLTCLEGPSQLQTGYCGCDVLSRFWAEVDQAIIGSLNKTFQELVADKQQAKKILQYTI